MKNQLQKETMGWKKIQFLLFACLCFMHSTLLAQEISISGKVISGEDVTGLPGVNVLIKGTDIGTITDFEGNYKIAVPSTESTLVFSYVGFLSQEIAVGNQTVINITLDTDAKKLSEVVVTALGVEREAKALGYAVQEVQGDELTEARETNVVNSLSGRVAGVQVTNGSSGVGSTSLVTIRGESSLVPGNSSPLFVVDGIPINNETISNRTEGNLETDYGNGAQDLNPDDIESISVLKGANASALYGSRGANGVILITTKSGSGTKGIGVSVNSNITFEEPLRIPKYQNQYGQGAGFQFEFGDGFGGGVNDNIDESWGPRLDGQLIRQHDSPTSNGFRGGDSHPSIDRGDITPTSWIAHPDNIESFFESGKTFTNNVALTGGNEFGNFRLSVTDLDNEGILPNTNYKRRTYALNANYNLTNKLRATASVNYINSSSDNRPNNSYGTENIMYLWVWFGRQIDMNSLRNYWQPGLEGVQQFNYNYNWHDNPFFTMFENTNAFEKDRIIGNISLTYDITDELSFMVRTGTDFFNELRVGKRAFSTQRFANGQYREDDIYFNEANTDFLLTYNKEINNDFQLSVSAGGNRRDVTDRYKRTSANELSIPNIYNFENSRIPLALTQSNAKKRVNSLYGFANLSYKNMVFLDITGRNDWSSTLPKDNNSYFYPSVSLSGILTDILSVSSSSALSFAKLRLGWAQVGNDTEPYRLRNVFNFQQPFGSTQQVSESGTINNSNLKPEQLTSFEVGADLRFFNGRLGLDVTYYKTSSKNQILNLPLDITSGYNSRIVNAGKIENSGIELMLTGTPVQISNGFRWDVSANFTRNRSKIVELIDGLKTYRISNNYVQVLAKVGGRMGDIYGTGFEETSDGQIIHNEDGFAIRDNTLKKLGNYNPDFMVGLSNNFSYKGFNLGVLFDWRQGGEIMSRTVLIGGTSGMMDFTVNGREEGIISEGVIRNDDGTFRPNDVRISGRDYYWWTYNRNNEEVGIFDASFLKLREVKFGYTLPNKLLKNLPFKDVNLSVVGRNLALWTENPHFDPESISFNGGTIVPGVEDMATPTSRSVGFNLSFKL
ncbi:SusC/RagA family TonB-linked outer membrane protein [Fulvivirgaceae bacterium BMA10]|uniref:SusC/RagA family TonB-linked outer membrane protein n=1 Tax=Splendidivirga corallicola TaxID=3051826 RepID=A0ABT8KX31_9BACT|nr:SusC/RagA family TonB-linked outer membrane protein [Fulvivirgaceae bacterium BMA10]